jgi:hypothetical protein
MKLRIKGNSIRLRITKPEIDQLGATGIIEEYTQIGNTKLGYSLVKSDTEASIRAELDGTHITVYMPKMMADEWVKTERVGYEHNMLLPTGSKLFILLEKDFKCLDATHEDQSDMYENPLAASHR